MNVIHGSPVLLGFVIPNHPCRLPAGVSSSAEEGTSIMQPKAPNVRTVKYNKRAVIAIIDPAIVLKEIILTAINVDDTFLTRNPGILAVAITIGLDDERIKKAIAIAPKDIRATIDSAVSYLARVGIGITQVGKAWGIIFNAIYGIGGANTDEEKARIFGNSPLNAIISPEGIITLINAATLTTFDINSEASKKRTGAELLQQQFGCIGDASTNAINVIISLAMQNKLSIPTLKSTIETLIQENAKISDLPTGIVSGIGKQATAQA